MIIDLVKEIIPTLRFKFPYSPEEYAEHLYFENYHCHKDFSNTLIADSGEPIENYAKRTLFLGGKCLFSGEHGSQGNQFHVYNVAEKNKLKYRHSTEAYWVKDRLADVQTGVDGDGNPVFGKDRTNCHIVLVAKNAEGRKDINYALSMANIDGYYYRPRIDLELLKNIPKDNVIVTSACIAGWAYQDATDTWLRIHDHFEDNFFFEIQANNTDEQKRLNEKILDLSSKYNIDIIAGLDSHYIGETGRIKRDQILKYKTITYPEEVGWYMDYPDVFTWISRFADQGVCNEYYTLRAIMNTNIFVNECEDIVFDRSFKIPSVYKDKTYKEKCKIFKHVLNESYKKETVKSKEKEDGIRFEAEQIIDSGVVDYFLTSQKIIQDAVENEDGILTTTSRGSAASFIVNKLLGLTTVDRTTSDVPIYPERFLTKERVQAGMMPDIDLNIATQEPFIRAAKKIVGEEGCYPLMAVEKLKVKAAWQLYAGSNNVAPATANQISKYIDEYELKIKHADEDEKDDIHVEDFIPSEYVDLFNKSNEYRGTVINLKQHACGYLLLDGDIRKEIGLISAKSESTGKRTLCACIEGKVLDDFGLTKEDFLIVDSVSLTHECFQAISQKVPSFDELRKMVKGDEKTWEIYEKGITCCVNQCEKEATIQKVMKYKPKSFAELSAFIAAIRPGFAPLLQDFLNRNPYSTGESEIDNVLSDTMHYMIYQESIMKVLNYLGLPMGDTYKIIKNISKKKYRDHPEELKKLKEQLISVWKQKIGSADHFDNVWSVIESSSAYAFNSPHAFSMAGDSLYQAWFKAHHTPVFYETAINHYQKKGKKDKIDALIKEMIKFYGYKLGDYRFGDDNRRVSINEEKHLIYPNMSSLKDFGELVAEVMYDIGKNSYDSFIDLYNDMTKAGINKTIIDKLIRIGYFEQFGSIHYLQKELEYYNLFYNMKSVNKDKIERLGLPLDIIKKYGHETTKQINKIDGPGLFNEMCDSIEDRDLSLKEILDNEYDVYGIIRFVDPSFDKRYYYVTGIDKKKTIVNISLYEIYSGKTRTVKMWTNSFDRYGFQEKDMLYITSLEKKYKREPTGEINPKTGKKIYRDIPDKFEYWLMRYEIKREEWQ